MMRLPHAPKGAIIIHAKDRPQLLNRALHRVNSQTFGDYVHVVLNDGDDKKKSERIINMHDEINKDLAQILNSDITQGDAKALNQAIHASKSKYVAVLDDDDNWDNAAKLQITKDESYYPVVAPATLGVR